MHAIAYLSLGSNIGNRAQNLREALARLETIGRVITLSSFYETEPVEFTNQPAFFNCVAGFETTDLPGQLMSHLLQIERAMGRQRVQKKGPRIIDIDILLFGDLVVNTPDLCIPHPAMAQRRFVLAPLVEIAPEAIHPVLNKSVQQLLRALPEGQDVRRLAMEE